MSKRIFIGHVTSDKADKTVSVLVAKKKYAFKYGKIVKYFMKYLAHDEENKYKIGDKVKIIESIPISKRKKWKVVE